MRSLFSVGFALVVGSSWSFGDYSDHPELAALKPALLEAQYSEQSINEIFAQAEKKQAIIDAISRPAEKVLQWYDYRKIFVTEQRIREGVEFMKAQGPALERAERELGVPSEIIAAIIGVETYYGRIAGSYRVIDALSTLAFDYPKRAPFFRKELVAYLTLAREQNIDPLQPVGSYAGAMGYGQFMPSSYRAYAIDFDGDEFIDIWGNPVDAIGSVANYLKRHGWKEGQPIAQTLAPDQFMSADWLSDGLKLPYTVAELPLPAGVISVGLPSNASIKPLQLETMNGPQQWLVFNNFYTITRYNHSSMYAMAVTELADALAAGLQAQ